jgi:hypothetical protein
VQPEHHLSGASLTIDEHRSRLNGTEMRSAVRLA